MERRDGVYRWERRVERKSGEQKEEVVEEEQRW